MATPNVGILTTTGKALIDKVNSGQAKISFSKVVFSSMDNSQLSDTQIKALTAIAPQEVVVSSPQTTLDTNSGETRIRATGTNEKLADGVYVKTYGVFAKDDTGNEILYGVTVSPNPNYFPAYDGVTPQAVTYSYKTVIQETSNITMTNSNDVYVSQEDLTEAIAKIPQPDLSGYDKTDDVDKKLQSKQDKLGYTAANDSTVVHTADMRKPASDVAGIEEVNVKADDSKVVHDNHDGTMQLNGTQVSPYNKLSDTIGGRNLAPNTSDDWQKVSVPGGWGTANLSNKIYEIKDGKTYTLQVEVRNMTSTIMLETFNFTAAGARNGLLIPHAYVSYDTKIIVTFTAKLPENYAYFQPNLAFSKSLTSAGSYEYRRFKLEEGNVATDCTPAPEDKVNVSDMRKPANDVAGIEEVNTKQDKIGYTPADDSKVAHLSGANNFDTVPTVNNNPLLLASSLPSDLARTSQQTNFTAGLQSGGVDVATAADLKSVEASAWRQLDNKYIIPDSGYTLAPYTTILYKIDDSIHTLYLSGTIVINDGPNTSVTVKLGSIIKSVLTVTAPYIDYSSYNSLWYPAYADKNSTDLKFLLQSGVISMTVSMGTGGSLAHITYDKLV